MGSAFSRSRKEPIVKLPDETVLIKGLGYSIGKKLSEGLPRSHLYSVM